MSDKERHAKLPEVRIKYKKMASNVAEAGHLILEMMRHPEVSPELALEAQASYARSYANFIQVRDSLRKLYPKQPSQYINAYPWDK
jgi:hypothetical protein